ncbi:hypothetical protein C6V83_16525 [Gordonia iterans]|uniref:GIY-YIG domain-containing protein n=1 Tax=Gordonia iterans TaxID=1004901 RepID=A0A2S0KIW4_9ACTN|nr:GIY-YIG nuclease family protein [Gordonia iterans]AVM01620.1 hypothetical protein C6V83_16525 [Gordonia iterans]
MTESDTVESWARSIGFSAPREFKGTNTRVGPDDRARYAGLYLLSFKNGDYYLGESVDIRSRMAGHRAKWGDEIASVQVRRRNLSKPALRRLEKELIHELNRRIPTGCRNITHASVSAGVDELADFLTKDEQDQWMRDPRAFNASDTTELKPMTEAQAVKYSTSARRFSELPTAAELTGLLRTYLENCVPAPRRTEFQSWNVSAWSYGGRRAFCVSIGKMESLVAFPDGSGFIVIRKSDLLQSTTAREFKRRFRGAVMTSRIYDDAGEDTVMLEGRSARAFADLLHDPVVQRAAARLVLDVMRKHPSVYTRYHCPQLVEKAYSEFSRPAPEDGIAVPTDEQHAAPVTLMSADRSSDADSPPAAAVGEAPPDDVVVTWFVNAGPAKTGKNTLGDFLANGEWRMDREARYEFDVQDMLPGERIFVRKRYNTKHAPFDTRGRLVSAMDLLLSGTIVSNPGDGCSVKVDWSHGFRSRTWYFYTNQDAVWAIPHGRHSWSDRLLDFALNDAEQDLDFWRNAHYWRERFGDTPVG